MFVLLIISLSLRWAALWSPSGFILSPCTLCFVTPPLQYSLSTLIPDKSFSSCSPLSRTVNWTSLFYCFQIFFIFSAGVRCLTWCNISSRCLKWVQTCKYSAAGELRCSTTAWNNHEHVKSIVMCNTRERFIITLLSDSWWTVSNLCSRTEDIWRLHSPQCNCLKFGGRLG